MVGTLDYSRWEEVLDSDEERQVAKDKEAKQAAAKRKVALATARSKERRDGGSDSGGGAPQSYALCLPISLERPAILPACLGAWLAEYVRGGVACRSQRCDQTAAARAICQVHKSKGQTEAGTRRIPPFCPYSSHFRREMVRVLVGRWVTPHDQGWDASGSEVASQWQGR